MPNARTASYAPAKAVDVTPHDTNGNSFSMLYVGGAGTVKVVDHEGNTSTWVCAAGTYINCATTKVLATGTTATAIVGMA